MTRFCCSGVSAIKLALLAQQAQSQSQALLSADPVAVIGMGCRLPGRRPDSRGLSGSCWPTASMRCRTFPTAVGTWTRFTIPIPPCRARWRRRGAGSSATSPGSTRRTSESCETKPSEWTRSNACCSKSRSRRWITRACQGRSSPVPEPGCSLRVTTTTMHNSSTAIPSRSIRGR